MKKIVSVLVFVMISQFAFSQDYLEEIADSSCTCINNLPDSMDKNVYLIKSMLCVLESSSVYKTQLKEDYDIEVGSVDDDSMDDLGDLIGTKIEIKCPEIVAVLEGLVGDVDEDESNNNVEIIGTTQKLIKGEVTKVEDDFFVVFHVKDEQGKVMKYYWFDFFNNEIDLINTYKTMVGKKVAITFVINEFFDPKIGEYRQFYSIKQLSVVE